MFRFLRNVARNIVKKIRRLEIIFLNVTLQRRGTVHSICRRGTIHSGYDRGQINTLRRRGTIHSIYEVRNSIYNQFNVDSNLK